MLIALDVSPPTMYAVLPDALLLTGYVSCDVRSK
jgi:hypothetical protein